MEQWAHGMAAGGDPDARACVLSLIDFLAAYDARRNPPVHDVAAYKRFFVRDTALPVVPDVVVAPGADAWLTVPFLVLPAKPAAPEEYEPFIGTTAQLGPGVALEVRLSDEATDEELALAGDAELWVHDVWDPWAERYREVHATKELYRQLFEQRELLNSDRDSLELVWGFGRLRWDRGDGLEAIDYPVLTVPVEVDLDAATNDVRVRPAGALEVETLHLADVPLDDPVGFKAIRDAWSADETGIDPWDNAALTGILRRVVRTFDHDGVVSGEGEPESTAASVDPSWVLFMRRRRPDYQGFLDGMRELYRDGALIPDPLQALVIDAPSTLGTDVDGAEGEATADAARPPQDPLLLPLATNLQQEAILSLAQRRPGVTVQGPPGTGKSHTIANIISHYVAYGQRVLVVAEKEQALRVLAEKIPPGIRDLTVSVLGTDEEGRRRLESSIRQIQTRVAGIDKRAADREIQRLEDALGETDRAIAATTNRLLAVSRNEASGLDGTWLAGKRPTPSDAAAWLAREATRLGYVPDAIGLSHECPLSGDQPARYLQLLRSVGLDEADACACVLPTPTELPTAAQLAGAMAELEGFHQRLGSASPELVAFDAVDRAAPGVVQTLAADLDAERQWLVRGEGPWLREVGGQLNDPLLRDRWMGSLADLRSEREQIITLARVLEAHIVRLPELVDPTFEAHLRAAREKLASKGKLGWLAGDAKRAVESCRVDDRTPASTDDIDVCLAELRRQSLRRQLVTRWTNRVGRFDGKTLDATAPEDAIGRDLEDLARLVSAAERWAALRTRCGELGITAPAEPSAEACERLRQILDAAAVRPAERTATARLDDLRSYLKRGASGVDSSDLWTHLREALDARQTETWGVHRQQVEHLTSIAPDARQLRDLHGRLQAVAPRWANALATDRSRFGDPALFEPAWQWRQLETWVSDIQRGDNPAELQRRLEDLAAQRRRVITDLVAERAWRRLADNLGDPQRQALNTYLQAVKLFGKTGGKYAARKLGEIRKALDESKDAIPVWIMPTSRALSSFRPDRVPPFDVLIVDEASQIGLEALPLLSVARATIVVGDDKQTSPENVGLNLEAVHGMLDSHLSGIPKYRTLFNPNSSLYDIAFQKFPGSIMLTEHFRCLPPIISFSNRHAYNGQIIPVRDQPPAPGWKALGAIKVLDGYRTADVNEPEARVVVDLVEELCDDPAYADMDLGVISLLGSSQSKLIWDMLVLDRIGPEVMQERRVRCGEPANFQGDERDIIILSLVAAIDPAHPTARVAAMTSLPAERRLNVAASRAKDQMWVVYSLDPDRFPTGDLRAELIRHCTTPGVLDAQAQDLEARCDSQFEIDVVRRILAKGYRRVRVQHPVGNHRIDIVVEGPDARLAIECDGDRWHGEDRWHHDRARQQVLERAQWTFERIRGSSFYRDPDAALEPLWQRLDALGIPTGETWLTETAQTTVRTVVSRPDDGRVDTDRGNDDLMPDASNGDDAHEALQAGEAASFALLDPAAPQRTLSLTRPDAATGRGWAPPVPTGVRPVPLPPPTPSAVAPQASPATLAPPALAADNGQGTSDEVYQLSTNYAAVDPTSNGSGIQRAPSTRPALAPYRPWRPVPLDEVSFATQDQIISGLVSIVEVEGPMHALRAYQLYQKASGGHRVGKDLRRTFNQATNRALRSGRLWQLNDALPGQVDKTLYVAGMEPVVVRELGPRLLVEVPRSEIKALAAELGLHDAALLKRALLETLGLTRLTERVNSYLDECFAYDWQST